MNKIYFLVLFFAYIGICIDCQGGGGSSRSHTSSHHHHHGRGSSGGPSLAMVIAIIIIIAVLIVIYIYCETCKNGQPVKSNTSFVSTNSQQFELLPTTNLFHSGIWLSEYKQYDQWHGPFEISLTFNCDSPVVIGSGWDDVGLYSISGTYSHETRPIGVTKTYQAGTGNTSQNLGHNVTIQLSHTQNSQFEGTWYVSTSEYNGEDEFRLTRKPEYGYVNSGYVKSENWV